MAKSGAELELIYKGATVSDLAIIFDTSPIEVNRRIAGKVAPITHESKVPKYRIRDAAPYLCNVIFDPEEFLKGMSPAKLPPALQDAFWKAQLSRQKFEEDKGDLWRTQRVVEVMGEVFKTIRMTTLMFVDTLEQETEVTARQRKVIQDLADGLLKTAGDALVEQFADYVAPADEHGRPLKEEEVPQFPLSDSIEEPFDDGFGDD